MLPKLNVTLVGAGHYARDLIYPKYMASDKWNVKATISPHSSIPGVPAFKNIWEWNRANSESEIYQDVFDLCVFPEQIIYYIMMCKTYGIKRVIIPKPIAETYNDLAVLIDMARGIDVVVASQWAFDKDLISRIKLSKDICFLFRQQFESRKQNIKNAFLPHVAQLIHSADAYNVPRIISCFEEHGKTRKVSIDGECVDLLSRGDLLAEMIDDFYVRFADWNYSPVSLDSYLPIAELYLRLKEEVV